MSELWSLSSSVFLVAVLARVSGELLRCHRCGRRRHGYLWLSFWLKTSWWSFPWASSWWSFPWAPSWWLWWWSLVSSLSLFFSVRMCRTSTPCLGRLCCCCACCLHRRCCFPSLHGHGHSVTSTMNAALAAVVVTAVVFVAATVVVVVPCINNNNNNLIGQEQRELLFCFSCWKWWSLGQ